MLFLKQIYIVLHTKDCGLGRISVSLLIPTYFPGKELYTRLRYGAASKLERKAAAEEPRLTRRKIPSKFRQIDACSTTGRPNSSNRRLTFNKFVNFLKPKQIRSKIDVNEAFYSS